VGTRLSGACCAKRAVSAGCFAKSVSNNENNNNENAAFPAHAPPSARRAERALKGGKSPRYNLRYCTVAHARVLSRSAYNSAYPSALSLHTQRTGAGRRVAYTAALVHYFPAYKRRTTNCTTARGTTRYRVRWQLNLRHLAERKRMAPSAWRKSNNASNTSGRRFSTPGHAPMSTVRAAASRRGSADFFSIWCWPAGSCCLPQALDTDRNCACTKAT